VVVAVAGGMVVVAVALVVTDRQSTVVLQSTMIFSANPGDIGLQLSSPWP
jgi:hypothetical protein